MQDVLLVIIFFLFLILPCLLHKRLADHGEFCQSCCYLVIDTACWIFAVSVSLTCWQASQQCDGLIDIFYGIDAKSASGCGLDHILAQHQVLDIGSRNQYALFAS